MVNSEIVVNPHGFPDFVVSEYELGNKIGYEVKYTINRSSAFMRLRDFIYRGYYEVSKGSLDHLKIVFATAPEILDEIIRLISKPSFEIPKGISIVIGSISLDEELDISPKFEFVQEFSEKPGQSPSHQTRLF